MCERERKRERDVCVCKREKERVETVCARKSACERERVCVCARERVKGAQQRIEDTRRDWPVKPLNSKP